MTDFFLLHVEIVDDNADEKIECEERAENDEEDEIQVHEDASFGHRLQSGLQPNTAHWYSKLIASAQLINY